MPGDEKATVILPLASVSENLKLLFEAKMGFGLHAVRDSKPASDLVVLD